MRAIHLEDRIWKCPRCGEVMIQKDEPTCCHNYYTICGIDFDLTEEKETVQ